MADKKPPIFSPERPDVRPLGAPAEPDLVVHDDARAVAPTDAPPETSPTRPDFVPEFRPWTGEREVQAAPPGQPPNSAPTPAPGPVQTFEQWARARKIDPATLAGAKAKNGWAIGQTMTEDEFIAGIKAFAEIEVR